QLSFTQLVPTSDTAELFFCERMGIFRGEADLRVVRHVLLRAAENRIKERATLGARWIAIFAQQAVPRDDGASRLFMRMWFASTDRVQVAVCERRAIGESW